MSEENETPEAPKKPGLYEGMGLLQMLGLRMLQHAAERLRGMTGATIWLSVAMPIGEVEGEPDRQAMNVIAYCVGCDCGECSAMNAAIIRAHVETIEATALKNATRESEYATGVFTGEEADAAIVAKVHEGEVDGR
jgi:hypothetical protein